jgi:hypothetical protein
MIGLWLGALLAINAATIYIGWRFLDNRERTAGACSTREAIAALAWEIPGSANGDVFEGTHRGRRVTVRARGTKYEIVIEGEPSAGTLTGPEALAAIRHAARTPEGLAAMPDWQALVHVFDAHPIRFEKGSLRAVASAGGGVLGSRDEAQRLKRLLDRLVEVTRIAHLALSLRTRAGSEARCPYCHDDFETRQRTIECPRCGVKHHEECYQEFGRCSVFACATRHGVMPDGIDLARHNRSDVSPEADAKQGFTR